MALRKKYPDLGITITNRQTSHKRYYTEESPRVVGFLDRYNRAKAREFAAKRGNKDA